MMPLTAVVAFDIARGMGKDNQLPWNIPQDLQHFKDTTKNGVLIMGGNTWDSLPKKPLPGRVCIVVTRKGRVSGHKDVFVVRSPKEALMIAETFYSLQQRPVFVIGGAQIFNAFLDKLTHAVVTLMHWRADTDVKMPVLPGLWSKDTRRTRIIESDQGKVEFQYLSKEKPCQK